jgi:hypothetical protein
METALRGRFQDSETTKKNIIANWNEDHLDAFIHCIVQVLKEVQIVLQSGEISLRANTVMHTT